MSMSSTENLGSHVDSYDPTLFSHIATVEDRHFWFRARSQLIGAFVKQIMEQFPEPHRVLEIGCGSGGVLRSLEQACSSKSLTGMDLFIDGLKFAQQRTSCNLVQGDMSNPPFQAHFHLIGMFDVLEHLPDDLEALQQTYDMLAPNGVLMVTVPAHQSLWSYFDEQHHYRRYEIADLDDRLKKAGYIVEYISQYMMILYPLMWAGRRIASKIDGRASNDASKTHDLTVKEMSVIPLVNQLTLSLLRIEREWLMKRKKLPIGTSLIAIARKPC